MRILLPQRVTAAPSKALAYERTGRGEPLVLLHPLGADRTVWDPVVPLLAPHRDTICVDLPGFGSSAPLNADRPPDPAALAAAVAGLLAGLGLDRGGAHLAGNSLGGWVALEAALAGEAATVTAIAPAGLWSRPLGPRPELARALTRRLGPAAGPLMRSAGVKRLALGRTVADPDRVPPAAAAVLLRSYGSSPGYDLVNGAMRAGTFTRLAEIPVAVTLAWPEHDRLVTRPQSVPPQIREVTLPGCGHIPMWDDPKAVAAVLLSGSEASRPPQ